MFTLLACGVSFLPFSIVFHFTYFVCTIIINNPIISFLFGSWGIFVLPSGIFVLIVKCSLQFDLVFSFEGTWYISKLAQAGDLASSPGTPILQELPRVVVAPQGIFWW